MAPTRNRLFLIGVSFVILNAISTPSYAEQDTGYCIKQLSDISGKLFTLQNNPNDAQAEHLTWRDLKNEKDQFKKDCKSYVASDSEAKTSMKNWSPVIDERTKRDAEFEVENHLHALGNECFSQKKAASCLEFATESEKAENAENAHDGYKMACQYGSKEGCDKLTSLNASRQKSEQEEAAKRLASEKAIEKQRKGQMAKQQAQRDALAKKANSSECKAAKLQYDYCSAQVAIARLQQRIDHENEVGAEVGYVNALALRNAASYKIQHKKRAKAMAEDYNKLTGKTLDVSSCQIEPGRELASMNSSHAKALTQEYQTQCGVSP